MIFHILPLYSRIMFIGIAALECFLAIMLLRWDAWKRYPAMSVYLTWQAAGTLAALLLARFGPLMSYWYTYFVVMTVVNLLAFGVALELYYKTCDPRIGLFAWGRRHVAIIISVSVAVAIIIGRLFAARNGGLLIRRIMTMDEVMFVALWATFCILGIYSRSLGFTWRPRMSGIAMGFIIYLTVSVICHFIAARSSLTVGLIGNQVAMAAEFLTMAWWLGVFWGEEKLPAKAISAQVEEMPAQYGETVEALARML
jgi:hypothetical protein